MVNQILDGIHLESNWLERVRNLSGSDRLMIQFSGSCDVRSGPVLDAIGELQEVKADYFIRTDEGSLFQYCPENNRPHVGQDCYPLIGMAGGGAVHPQSVTEIIVSGIEAKVQS